MYYLKPICFICLKSKDCLSVCKLEMLRKLLYCVEKTEDFMPLNCNKTKICNDCLNKLNVTFYFKRMCLSNIVQFKNYINQLEQVCNKFNPYKVMTVQLNDINKLKGALKVDESVDFNIERYSDEQSGTAVVKEEVEEDEDVDKIYFENHSNNESQETILDQKLKLQSRTKEIKKKTQNQSKKVTLEESPDLDAEQHLDVQTEKVLIKSEILDKIYLQSSEDYEPQKQNSNENLKLFLHKEEILDDIFKENQHEGISKTGYFEAEESNKILSSEDINELPFTCTICEKQFTRKKNLRQHLWRHRTKKLYCCDKCQKGFITKYSLNRHSLSHINEHSYSCTLCEKKFKFKKNLNQHLLIHSNEPYSCSVCIKRFTREGDLNRHMLSHSKERPYSCSICKKSFIYKNSLKQHVLIHNNIRPYSCSICMKSFIRNSALKVHNLIHSKPKQSYSCPVCMETFTLKTYLRQHMSIHSKKPLYACSVCMESFTQKNYLKQHMLIHSNEWQYSCLICKKSFNFKGNLNQHMLIHSNERQYSCSICMKSFNFKGHLKRHVLIHFKNKRAGKNYSEEKFKTSFVDS